MSRKLRPSKLPAEAKEKIEKLVSEIGAINDGAKIDYEKELLIVYNEGGYCRVDIPLHLIGKIISMVQYYGGSVKK
jgi:hypothetical protein